jgi:hypothetical protein
MIRSANELIKRDKSACILYPDFKGGEYEFGVVVESFAAVKKITETRPFTARIPLTNRETRLESFNWICERALAVASRDGKHVLLLVDEAQRVTNKNKNADGFELVQENGGMYGVDLIFTTHRPSDVHGSLRAACDRVIIFQTHHTADIKVFQEHCDVPDNVFRALSKDDFLEWHVQHGYRIVRKGEPGKWVTPYEDENAQ